VKKQIIKDCICKFTLDNHEKVKKIILDCIHNDNNHSKNAYIDTITKFDWKVGDDFERPWVKYFLPLFEKILEKFLLEIGVQKIGKLSAIWYQQYENKSYHGWHIHGGHYTGVYYLELPKNSPQTEILHPFNNKITKINAKEGDIIFFPSHIIHRAPKNEGSRKTIISYNFDLFDRINCPFLINEL
jgi:hypothetical protein